MNIAEGLYGTSKSSYLKLENARMIVRHKNRINEQMLGARGRNIEAIFIENGVGERILFPTTNLAPARAMTSHVDQGGNWADAVGAQITAMAKDFAALGAASRHIYLFGGNLDESAGDLRQTIRETMSDMRRVFEGLCRKTRYQTIRDSLADYTPTLNENSDVSTKITELSNLLNSGAHALNENVIETVARVLEDDNRFKLAREPKNDELIAILGRKVSRKAWDDFKTRETVPLFAKPDLSNSPSSFTNVNAKLAYFAGALAAQCKDDSFGNLLSFISERLPEEKNASTARNMQAVAALALRYSGVYMPKDVIKTQAVREFVEWMDGFDPAKVLAEDLAEDCAEDCAEDLAEDYCPDCGLEEGDDLTSDDLTREDILLPKNQEDDLFDEVETDGEHDDDYLSRMQTLAGVSPPGYGYASPSVRNFT